MLSPTLVQYRGGGYDGCFWEYNYIYFDAEGVFHNVFSSGHAGVNILEQMREKGVLEAESTYTYDMRNPESMAEFGRESAVDHVIAIGKWLEKSEYADGGLYVDCGICGGNVDAAECTGEEQEGAGGIMIASTLLVCPDCWGTHSCPYCGEFYSDYDANFPKECTEGYCQYCHETHCPSRQCG